jgi:uncharacterized protein with gpF-like domain
MRQMKKIKTTRPTLPNKGIEVSYRKKLQKIITDMSADLNKRVLAAYHTDELDAVMQSVGDEWQVKFDKLAEKMATDFVSSGQRYASQSFAAALKDAGWTVDFKMTIPMRSVMDEVITDNVGLIKSIPAKHLSQVRDVIQESISRGRDLHYATEELANRFGVTKRRAAFIAQNQNNKMTAQFNRVRREELGITEAIWRHSHAGKEPRASHVHADGRKFNVTDGCMIDGEFIQPGELPRCRCYSVPVLPF